jgi:hypothetical protein
VWSIERRQVFLDELAATANVSASARAAGMKEAQAYTERRKSRVFREAWEAALCEGFSRLELMMLERAMKALKHEVGDIDPARTRMEEYSNKLALTLLAAHRATVRGVRAVGAKAPTVSRVTGVKERLAAKFDVMHERRNAEPSSQRPAGMRAKPSGLLLCQPRSAPNG